MAIRIIDVAQEGRWLKVRREVDKPDGSVEVSEVAFPIETLAMRAGEYGIPVTQAEELLDLVLHETLPDFAEEGQAVAYVVSAPSPDRGRAWQLQRLGAVRERHRTRGVPPGKADRAARAAIIRASDLDPELAQLAGETFDRQIPQARAEYRRTQARAEALAAVEAAPNGDGTSTLKAQLRRRLAAVPTPPGRA